MNDFDLAHRDADTKPVSLVGLSAAEFAAVYDMKLRRDLIRTLMRRDEHGALDLIARRNWWGALEQVAAYLAFTGSAATYVAESLSSNIQEYPNIIDRLAELQAERLATYAGLRHVPAAALSAIWTGLLPHLSTISSTSRLRLLRAILSNDIITSEEAMQYISPPLAEQPSDDLFSEERFKESEPLYDLVPVLLKRSNAQQARKIFKTLVPYQSIADSSAGYGESMHVDSVFHGPQNLYECANIVADKMSLTAAVAWSSRTLLESYLLSYRRWSLQFSGQELSGSGHSTLGNQYTYQDNGWLIKVLVPLTEKWLDTVNASNLAKHLERYKRFTPLHPAFRLRAIILAMKKTSLASVSTVLVKSAARGGGLPSISDAVARRAQESQELAIDLLKDTVDRVGYLKGPDEAAALHRLIAAGNQTARNLAIRIVSNRQFGDLEDLQVGFFAQLDWAAQDADFALTLLETALNAGYRPVLFSSRYVNEIIRIIFNNELLRDRIIDNALLQRFIPYVIGDDDSLFAEYAIPLFSSADIASKIELTRKAADRGLDLGLQILNLALADADPLFDSDVENRASKGEVSTITGVRTTGYFELHRLYNKYGLEAHRRARFDILQIAARERGSYGIRYAAIALSALRDAAIRSGDLQVADDVISVVETLSARKVHPVVEIELSDILLHHWARLSDAQKDRYWLRFNYSKGGAAFALLLALISKAPSDVTRARSNFSESSPDVRNYMAWTFWRRLALDETLASLEDPLIEEFLSMFLSLPDEATYNTIGRLLAHTAQKSPKIALNRLIDLSYSAVENDVRVFFSFDDGIDYSSASPEKALALAERLTSVNADSNNAGVSAFVISLLRSIVKSEYTLRVRLAFEALREMPYAVEAYREWRQRISQ